MPGTPRGGGGGGGGDGGWELTTLERRYSVPPNAAPPLDPRMQQMPPGGPSASEDLHAWSIYRQNLNSDFTDSALGSSEKSPLPYGNFQLRESTVQSILSHPRYGPKSALGANMYTYLKFGLPRVFPPSRGPRDGSSGYDSSDDGSPYLHRQGRHYLRSRSDPDFRNQQLNKPYTGHLPAGPRQPGQESWVRAKSHSEANLLADVYTRPPPHEHRRSMHDIRQPYPAEQPPPPDNRNRRPSKSGSAHSSRSRRVSSRNHEAPRLGPVPESGSMPEVGGTLPREAYYAPLPEHAETLGAFRYPHLQVRGLEVEEGRAMILQGAAFEAFGGEIMAVMATSEEEGTSLLDAVSGRCGNKVRGDVLLNGQSVRSAQLRERVAYVQNDSHLSPDLTVRQTLALHRWLRRPATSPNKVNAGDRVAALVEDLGLAQVAHTKVANLTTSERRRLNVACHLLLDTDIVVLDQPTRGMDIFDTFFLVEFLRQWAGDAATGGLSGGHIVILTLHPPTYEIFTMLSRVVLLSAGRTMFAGRRRDMLPYFATVDYPCPAFKNPSDYYLDLVTLDDLSAEAMLESSQRIEQLADIFRRRQEPLSDPGPPVALPSRVRRANCLSQAVALFFRAVIYSQPLTLVRWFSLVLLSALTSLFLGAVFFDLPASDPHLTLSDRLGFHYTMSLLAPWPMLLLLSLGEVGRERFPVSRDIGDQLYGRFVYIIVKILFSFPASLCVWISFLVPAYLMTGLHMQGNDEFAFYIYVGYMALYLCSMQALLTALAYSFKSRILAAGLAGLLFAALALVSGLPVHPDDVGEWASWLRWASPARWLLPVIVQREHSVEALAASALMCRNKQVQHQDIIVQLPCPPPNGTAALVFHGLSPVARQPEYLPPTSVGIFWAFWTIIAIIAFLARRFTPRQPRNNPNKP